MELYLTQLLPALLIIILLIVNMKRAKQAIYAENAPDNPILRQAEKMWLTRAWLSLKRNRRDHVANRESMAHADAQQLGQMTPEPLRASR